MNLLITYGILFFAVTEAAAADADTHLTSDKEGLNSDGDNLITDSREVTKNEIDDSYDSFFDNDFDTNNLLRGSSSPYNDNEMEKINVIQKEANMKIAALKKNLKHQMIILEENESTKISAIYAREDIEKTKANYNDLDDEEIANEKEFVDEKDGDESKESIRYDGSKYFKDNEDFEDALGYEGGNTYNEGMSDELSLDGAIMEEVNDHNNKDDAVLRRRTSYIEETVNPVFLPIGDAGTNKYIYSSRDDADSACRDNNMQLCTVSQIKGHSKCAAGWLANGSRKYWMEEPTVGCGNRRGYISWKQTNAGAYCCPQKTQYFIYLTTADIQHADTRSNISLTIYGTNGSNTKEIKLNNIEAFGKVPFKRGQIDYFLFEIIDVGEISKIEIRSDGTGSGPGWRLESASIHYQHKEKHITFDKWITKGLFRIFLRY